MKLHGIDRDITVQSSNVDVGDALTEHAKSKIKTVASKFFGRITDANVHFKKEGQFYHCSIRFKVGALRPFTGEMTHINPYRAFNYALDKAATQMRRLKRELREDKATRVDKFVNLDPALTAKPAPAPTIEETYDLTTIEGADDYVKAMTQAAKQGREAAQSQDEPDPPSNIRAWRQAAE